MIWRAALWLAFLAPFFYLTYGTANWLASLRGGVPNLAFGWERAVPFLAWSILPYWSINAFYGLSLFINDTPGGVDRLAKRYLTTQIVAVACFVAFPLAAVFERPETDGLPGFMFDVLVGFDKPFNQAPSLHIALLVVIWDHLRRRLGGPWLVLWHGWCFLIGASVLTTFQHHFIDIPTGALLGLFALWLFPHDAASPLAGFRWTHEPGRRRLGLVYLGGAVLFLALAALGAIGWSGAALLWLWPSLALLLVSVAYFGAGTTIFQKRPDGSVSLASRWLLMPYRLGVAINRWAWTRNLPASIEIADGVSLGRFPTAREAASFASIIDISAELVAPKNVAARWQSLPALDLQALSPYDAAVAASTVEAMRANGKVLVCCALGFQRSAAVVAAWLMKTGRANNAVEAIDIIRAKGRRIHLSAQMIGQAGDIAP